MDKDFLKKNWMFIAVAAAIVWYFFIYKKKPATAAAPGGVPITGCLNDLGLLEDQYGQMLAQLPNAGAEDIAFQLNKLTGATKNAYDRATLLDFFRAKGYPKSYLTANFNGLRCDL